DVRAFEKTLSQGAEPFLARLRDQRLAAGIGRYEHRAADGFEAGGVHEVRERELADLLGRTLVGQVHTHDAGRRNADRRRIGRQRDRWVDEIAVDRDEPALRVGLEVAGARVRNLSARPRDLKEAGAFDRDVET